MRTRFGGSFGRLRIVVVIGGLTIAVVTAIPRSAGATIVMSGARDDAGITAPRWGAENYTALTTGPATFTLDWEGDGNLAISLRDTATLQWLAADTSTDRPKTLPYDLTAGTTYRIAVWAMSGSGTFTVDLDDGGGVPPPTTTTTLPDGVQTQCGVSNGFDLCLHVEEATLTGHADVWVTFNGAADVFALEFA